MVAPFQKRGLALWGFALGSFLVSSFGPKFLSAFRDPFSTPSMLLGLAGVMSFVAVMGGIAFLAAALYVWLRGGLTLDQTRKFIRILWVLVGVFAFLVMAIGFGLYYTV